MIRHSFICWHSIQKSKRFRKFWSKSKCFQNIVACSLRCQEAVMLLRFADAYRYRRMAFRSFHVLARQSIKSRHIQNVHKLAKEYINRAALLNSWNAWIRLSIIQKNRLATNSNNIALCNSHAIPLAKTIGEISTENTLISSHKDDSVAKSKQTRQSIPRFRSMISTASLVKVLKAWSSIVKKRRLARKHCDKLSKIVHERIKKRAFILLANEWLRALLCQCNTDHLDSVLHHSSTVLTAKLLQKSDVCKRASLLRHEIDNLASRIGSTFEVQSDTEERLKDLSASIALQNSCKNTLVEQLGMITTAKPSLVLARSPVPSNTIRETSKLVGISKRYFQDLQTEYERALSLQRSFNSQYEYTEERMLATIDATADNVETIRHLDENIQNIRISRQRSNVLMKQFNDSILESSVIVAHELKSREVLLREATKTIETVRKTI